LVVDFINKGSGGKVGVRIGDRQRSHDRTFMNFHQHCIFTPVVDCFYKDVVEGERKESLYV